VYTKCHRFKTDGLIKIESCVFGNATMDRTNKKRKSTFTFITGVFRRAEAMHNNQTQKYEREMK
jgi:hypothetical protein